MRRGRSTAATPPARATSSRTAASRTCASSASRPRARSCSATSARSGCASRRRAISSTPRSARASAGSNSILRMREVLDAVLEWIPTWEDDPENGYRGAKAIVNVGAINGGFGWRVSRTPHRTDLFLDVRVPPTKPMAEARRQVLEMVRGLRERFPDYGVEAEVYVTAPGAEIEEDHPLVAAIDASHEEVFGVAAGARRDPVVLGRLGADALRDPDRQLRHLDRPARRAVRRESRDRRPREDGERLRARCAARVRGRSERRRLCAAARPAGSGGRRRVRRARRRWRFRLSVLPSSQGPVDLAELARERLVLYVYPRSGPAGRAAAARLGRDSGRAGLHAAVVRVPRPCGGAGRARRARRRACRRRASTTRSSSRSATTCRSQW